MIFSLNLKVCQKYLTSIFNISSSLYGATDVIDGRKLPNSGNSKDSPRNNPQIKAMTNKVEQDAKIAKIQKQTPKGAVVDPKGNVAPIDMEKVEKMKAQRLAAAAKSGTSNNAASPNAKSLATKPNNAASPNAKSLATTSNNTTRSSSPVRTTNNAQPANAATSNIAPKTTSTQDSSKRLSSGDVQSVSKAIDKGSEGPKSNKIQVAPKTIEPKLSSKPTMDKAATIPSTPKNNKIKITPKKEIEPKSSKLKSSSFSRKERDIDVSSDIAPKPKNVGDMAVALTAGALATTTGAAMVFKSQGLFSSSDSFNKQLATDLAPLVKGSVRKIFNRVKEGKSIPKDAFNAIAQGTVSDLSYLFEEKKVDEAIKEVYKAVAQSYTADQKDITISSSLLKKIKSIAIRRGKLDNLTDSARMLNKLLERNKDNTINNKAKYTLKKLCKILKALLIMKDPSQDTKSIDSKALGKIANNFELQRIAIEKQASALSNIDPDKAIRNPLSVLTGSFLQFCKDAFNKNSQLLFTSPPAAGKSAGVTEISAQNGYAVINFSPIKLNAVSHIRKSLDKVIQESCDTMVDALNAPKDMVKLYNAQLAVIKGVVMVFDEQSIPSNPNNPRDVDRNHPLAELLAAMAFNDFGVAVFKGDTEYEEHKKTFNECIQNLYNATYDNKGEETILKTSLDKILKKLDKNELDRNLSLVQFTGIFERILPQFIFQCNKEIISEEAEDGLKKLLYKMINGSDAEGMISGNSDISADLMESIIKGQYAKIGVGKIIFMTNDLVAPADTVTSRLDIRTFFANSSDKAEMGEYIISDLFVKSEKSIDSDTLKFLKDALLGFVFQYYSSSINTSDTSTDLAKSIDLRIMGMMSSAYKSDQSALSKFLDKLKSNSEMKFLDLMLKSIYNSSLRNDSLNFWIASISESQNDTKNYADMAKILTGGRFVSTTIDMYDDTLPLLSDAINQPTPPTSNNILSNILPVLLMIDAIADKYNDMRSLDDTLKQMETPDQIKLRKRHMAKLFGGEQALSIQEAKQLINFVSDVNIKRRLNVALNNWIAIGDTYKKKYVGYNAENTFVSLEYLLLSAGIGEFHLSEGTLVNSAIPNSEKNTDIFGAYDSAIFKLPYKNETAPGGGAPTPTSIKQVLPEYQHYLNYNKKFKTDLRSVLKDIFGVGMPAIPRSALYNMLREFYEYIEAPAQTKVTITEKMKSAVVVAGTSNFREFEEESVFTRANKGNTRDIANFIKEMFGIAGNSVSDDNMKKFIEYFKSPANKEIGSILATPYNVMKTDIDKVKSVFDKSRKYFNITKGADDIMLNGSTKERTQLMLFAIMYKRQDKLGGNFDVFEKSSAVSRNSIIEERLLLLCKNSIQIIINNGDVTGFNSSTNDVRANLQSYYENLNKNSSSKLSELKKSAEFAKLIEFIKSMLGVELTENLSNDHFTKYYASIESAKGSSNSEDEKNKLTEVSNAMQALEKIVL